MSAKNVRLKVIDIEVSGQSVKLFFSMGAAHELAIKYGSTQTAEAEFYKACFKVEDGKLREKTAEELLTKEFFDIMRSYISAMLYQFDGCKEQFFDNCAVDELPVLIKAIIDALGIGNPEPVAGKQGSTGER